jgi:hypothetical protein
MKATIKKNDAIMKNKILLYLAFVGLIGGLISCEKEGDQVYMLESPKAPTIQTMPDLTLVRDNGTDTLEFVGTPVDPGFEASATYILEAAPAGSDFADPVQLFSGVQPNSMKVTVSDLNGKLLKKFPADENATIEIRLRAVLKVSAGTGAPGTGTDPFEYSSEAEVVDVTPYGLPRLDLIGTEMDQKIESPLGDGNYTGLVKLDPAMPFTLLDPDTDISYGGSSGTLVADGDGIVVDGAGWHILDADVNNLTYNADPYMIGVVGSATPNGWDAPDQKMEYNPETGTWSVTLDLFDGMIKFRRNDDWGWNLGGTADSLEKDGPDIPVTAGNYTIILTINDDGDTGSFELDEN